MRLPKPHGQPTAVVWLTAAASLVLPVVGVGAAIYGIIVAASGDAAGWYWAGAGVVLVLIDMVIDQIWANPKVSPSDEPDLNRRGAELVGQAVVVVEAIAPDGRGTVRAGDTVWVAEGCAAGPGERVRVAGVKGTLLVVEAV